MRQELAAMKWLMVVTRRGNPDHEEAGWAEEILQSTGGSKGILEAALLKGSPSLYDTGKMDWEGS